MGAVLLLLVRCESDDDCDRMCNDEAECFQFVCDPAEYGPDCDEEEERESYHRECLSQCNAAKDRGETCKGAISELSDCYEDQGCRKQDEACDDQSTRYADLCVVEHRGDISCSHLCHDVEPGCIPYEDVGFSGDDCEAACIDAAEDAACAEAAIQMAACLKDQEEGINGWCHTLDTACAAKVEKFAGSCDGFGPGAVDPSDAEFCDEATRWLCGCGIKVGDLSCERMTRNQCFIRAWAREPCRASWDALLSCMQPLPVCSRETVGDACPDERAAFFDSCN